MSATADLIAPSKLATFGAAVLVGLSISTLVSGGQVTLLAIGSVPGVALGGLGLVAGLGLYTGVKRYSASGCGCGSDCNC